MKTYRMNAVMAGLLYFMGSIFGILSIVTGGELLSSVSMSKPLKGVNILQLAGENFSNLSNGAFFVLLMGIALTTMTVFLYPVIKKDSTELAIGLVLFRGAIEGTWYIIATLNILALAFLGREYIQMGTESVDLQSLGNVVYEFQGMIGPIGSMMFLIGATFLYISFFRTKLIPRWLTLWGFVGVVPYFIYVLLKYFDLDNGIGFYLEMVLAPQEMVMGLWLIIKGFNQDAMKKLCKDTE